MSLRTVKDNFLLHVETTRTLTVGRKKLFFFVLFNSLNLFIFIILTRI